MPVLCQALVADSIGLGVSLEGKILGTIGSTAKLELASIRLVKDNKIGLSVFILEISL
jgi:hypothetical protein